MEDTNTKGKITELEVLSYVIKKGYSVSIPFGDKDRYDQIWDIDGKLYKVQVKTSSLKDNGTYLEFACYTVCNGKKHTYLKEEIDLFATYYNNQVYVVPIEECSTNKRLRFTSTRPNQPNISWAKDYTFEEVFEKNEH